MTENSKNNRRSGICYLWAIILIATCFAALAANADAEQTTTVSIRVMMSGPRPTMLPAGDDENHYVGVGHREGEAVFSDGKKAKYSNVYMLDWHRDGSSDSWGYTKMVFNDGSWLFLKWNAAVVGIDENGPVSKGKGTILKGTGPYEGIKGTAEFTSRNLKSPPGDSESSAVLTYTLP